VGIGGGSGVGGWRGWEKVVQTMYTHVSKCKNGKIKGERKKSKKTKNKKLCSRQRKE
jgi:hypothetical protein